MPVLRRLSVNIPESEVLRLQGLSPAALSRAYIQQRLGEAVSEAARLARPLAIYIIKGVSQIADNQVRLEGGIAFHGENLARSWQGSGFLGIALCTIGPAVESRVSQLYSQGNFTAASLLDSAGSVAVESVADGLNYHLCQWAARKGMQTGPRLSPGYGKWDVAEQRLLFNLIHSDKVGVQLNEQCMMVPAKSISFCIGVGKGRGLAALSPCRYCSLRNCQYRRRP